MGQREFNRQTTIMATRSVNTGSALLTSNTPLGQDVIEYIHLYAPPGTICSVLALAVVFAAIPGSAAEKKFMIIESNGLGTAYFDGLSQDQMQYFYGEPTGMVTIKPSDKGALTGNINNITFDVATGMSVYFRHSSPINTTASRQLIVSYRKEIIE